ncbi:UNVERIFIED_CONTAM: hypothetical protein PYX00_008775 [Menopon gallinae]|uniref:Uncharacterized protein n=1 Tax=Menopon gallinae TaxID=328185 RepID=A0AAW2HPK3_9NEOP
MLTVKQFSLKLLSGILPVLLPPSHIYVLYKFWGRYARLVDKRYCSCSCWDTVFKGTYETGIAAYKHMYFNATLNTTKIWLMTVTGILVLYESCKFQLKLLYESHLRYLMSILFLSSLFSHYYTWWVYVNYLNDDFYVEWNHQLFFTVTEIASTVTVLNLSNSKVPVDLSKVIIIVSIAVTHILAGGLDQFISNVIWGEGFAHQILRDVCFMVPDILHLILPVIEYLKFRNGSEYQIDLINIKKHCFLFALLVVTGFSISYLL